jgi:predicted SprT family Zn-dependent metalloprotease
MALDKFFGGSAPKPIKKITKKTTNKADVEISVGGRQRFELKCQNKKCNYVHVVRKVALDDQDYICAKCGGTMKIKLQKAKKEEDEDSETEEDSN